MSEAPMISIVDDNAWSREGLKDFVLSLGYRALAFASAEHFVESGCIADTTCLIADVQMPGLSGLDLQDYLLSHGHRTPIIFITAYPDEKCRSRALGAGAVGFFSKPFDEETLIECLALAVTTAGREARS